MSDVDHRAFVCVAPGQCPTEYLNEHQELIDSGTIVINHPQAWLMMKEFIDVLFNNIPPNQAGRVLTNQVIVDALIPPPLDPSEPPEDPPFQDWYIDRGMGNLN